MNATLKFNNGAAYIDRPCRIIGETRMRYAVVFDQPTLTPAGMFMPGEELMVPKHAVHVQEQPPCV